MKITALKTTIVRMPFDPPIKGGSGLLTSADCVLVHLESDQGLVGEGLVFALNGNRIHVMHEMVKSFEPLVVGLDLAYAGGFRGAAWKDINFVGHRGISILGLAGIDMALWDLRAKAVDLNVAQLIGAYRPSVPVYNSIGLFMPSTIDELQRDAADYVAQGYRAMKMRLGKPDPKEDLARARAIREAIGPDVALMADLNQQCDVTRAIRLGRLLEEINLAWIEEPVNYQNHIGEAEVAAALDTPIASGETEYAARGMLEMLKLNSVDILMPDLQRMGGPTGMLRVGALAEVFDRPITSHLFPEMNLALLAAMPNAYYLEGMPWFTPLYAERIELDKEGRAIVPNRPGWGFSFDPKAVERFRV